MADSVQYALDRMVADLDDLLRRGIFSEVSSRVFVWFAVSTAAGSNLLVGLMVVSTDSTVLERRLCVRVFVETLLSGDANIHSWCTVSSTHGLVGPGMVDWMENVNTSTTLTCLY